MLVKQIKQKSIIVEIPIVLRHRHDVRLNKKVHVKAECCWHIANVQKMLAINALWLL